MIAVLIAAIAVLVAPAPQARDVPVSGKPATGVIGGIVVSDDQEARPLRRVAVTLSAGDMGAPVTTMTGDDGRFTFSAVRAGTYTLSATKPAYVQAYYGGKRPGRPPGVPIALLDGQRLDDLTIRVLRGGAVTGTITQPSGRPAANVVVQVFEVGPGGGKRSSIETHIATTDDRGVYRMFGLPPGQYLVEARPTEGFGVVHARRMTDDHLRWAQQMTAGGAAASSVASPPDAPMVTYATVYYPGTPDAAFARVIRVEPGQERAGVDFSTEFVATTRLSGVVLGADGSVVEGAEISVRGMDVGFGPMAALFRETIRTTTGQDGTFVLDKLRPGRHTIVARAADPNERSPTKPDTPGSIFGLLMAGAFGGQSGSQKPLWAQTEVVADGRDVSNLQLRLQPGMTVSGRIVFEGTSAPPAMPEVRVVLGPASVETSRVHQAAAMILNSVSANAANAGTFAIKGVAPDRYRATVVMPGLMMGQIFPGTVWTLKAIDLNGKDVADLPFDVRPNENVSGLVVTITDQPTRLSGLVIDPAGRPAPGYPIVIFSTDRDYWLAGSRRVQHVRPSNDGKYEVIGLPAGEYYVSAVSDIDDMEHPSIELLEYLSTAAFRLRLAAGERRVQDVKLGGGVTPAMR